MPEQSVGNEIPLRGQFANEQAEKNNEQLKVDRFIQKTPQLQQLEQSGYPVAQALQSLLDKKQANWGRNQESGWNFRMNGNSIEWNVAYIYRDELQSQDPRVAQVGEGTKMIINRGEPIPTAESRIVIPMSELYQEMSVLAQNQAPQVPEMQQVSNLVNTQLTGFVMQNPDFIPFKEDILTQITKDAAGFVQDGFIQSVEQVSLFQSDVPNAVQVVFVDARGKSAAIDIPLPDVASVEQVAQQAQAKHVRFAALRAQLERN